MAEAVVSFVVERLGDLLISEAKFLYGVTDQIDEIQRDLKRMQCFLKEADKKQIRDERVRNWVAEMKELAYKIEDVIETYALDVASKPPKSGFLKMLRRFACIVREGLSLHKFGNEINIIKGELNSLTASLQTFGITKGLEEGESSNSVDLRNRRIFYSHNIEKDFVGMEKEIQQLVSHLKKEDEQCEVVSICGMGGQGKTTVATQLYNHPQVKAHFEAFAWVCITQQFDREKILKSILEQLLPAGRKAEVSTMGNEVMVGELHKVQQEKKCLVVIDDIWTTDAWKNLTSAFPIGVTESRSKILLTTRDETVAQVGSVYKLPGLTEEEGWKLLSKKAFSLTGESPGKGVLSEMESIGKKMVVRSKGLPLAVSTLGGMLRGKVLRDWEMINRDISFYLARGEACDNDEYQTVTHVLGLSYDSLSPRLRQCFLCLGNYKEDEIINAEKLYLFWIGEGLISPEDKAQGGIMLEVAERYLDELAHRSLVQVHPLAEEGVSWCKFETCIVHDLIRELCLKKVKEEKVIRIIDVPHKPDQESKVSNNRVRRLCIHSSDIMDESTVDETVIPQIRSLFQFNKQKNYNGEERIFSLEKYKLLRVLTVQGFALNAESLTSIGKLVYLKYLSFNGCVVVGELPSSIGNLRNLETLDLRVHYPSKIPNVLWKLKQLKRLYLGYLTEPVNNPEKLRLDGLNELELIQRFDSRYFEIQDLIMLSKIKVFKEGRITVDEENPMIIENTIEFMKSKELCYSSLDINIAGGRDVSLILLLQCSFIDCLFIGSPITVLPDEYDNNQLSMRLTFLHLYKTEMEEDSMMLLEKLPNLHHLRLNEDSYAGKEMVCSAMGFSLLQSLTLYGLPNLTNWRVDEGAMPNLSKLTIDNCSKLEMLPDGLRFITALKHLEISGMPTALGDRIRVKDEIEALIFTKLVMFLL